MFEVLGYEFFRNALAAGVLASVACGIIGTYVVVRRMVSVSGGISHAAFGGVGLGYFLGIDPLLGATGFTVATALGMGALELRARQHMDTLIGAVWAAGMAIGILFVYLTPGFAPDLFSYLFGNILLVPRGRHPVDGGARRHHRHRRGPPLPGAPGGHLRPGLRNGHEPSGRAALAPPPRADCADGGDADPGGPGSSW